MKASRSPRVTAEKPRAPPYRPPGVQQRRYVHDLSVCTKRNVGICVDAVADAIVPILLIPLCVQLPVTAQAGGCVWIGGNGRGERVCVCARARLHVIENIYNNNYNIPHFK